MGKQSFLFIAALIAILMPKSSAQANDITPPPANSTYRQEVIEKLEAQNNSHRAEMKMINEAGLSEGNPRDQIRRLKWLQQEISLNEKSISRMKLGQLTAKELLEEVLHGFQIAGKGIKGGVKGKLLGSAAIISTGATVKELLVNAPEGFNDSEEYNSREINSNGLLDKIRLQGAAR